MSYAIVEIEIEQPLTEIVLSEVETGIALIVRRKNRVVDFIMQELLPNTTVSVEQIAHLIAKKTGLKILQEQIREELTIVNSDTPTFPTLTVAICTKDRSHNVQRCLNSLLSLQNSSDRTTLSFEILIVDNAPSDEDTKKLVEQLPTVNYTCEPRPGLDFARNHAIAKATGKILAFIDDDVVVDPNWLSGLQEAWKENPDAAAFTGLVLPYELATQAQILFELGGGFRRGFEKIRYGQSLRENPLYPCGAGIFGAGCNMAFRRDVLLKLGGFDEALDTGAPLPGGGDLDIFYRVIRGGFILVYEPQYLVFHQHRQDIAKLRRQYWSWGLGFMAFVVKSYSSDPQKRPDLLRLVKWWFLKYQWQQLNNSIKGRSSLPSGMILAEIWGGVVGLCGEYQRSIARIDRIKSQFSQSV